MAELDAEKLKENALTSIRLGIEDFQRTKQVKEQGVDPARALSAGLGFAEEAVLPAYFGPGEDRLLLALRF